jgi:hypothetical protein
MAGAELRAARATEDELRVVVVRRRAAAYSPSATAAEIRDLRELEEKLAESERRRGDLEVLEGAEGVIASEKRGHLFSSGGNELVATITLAMAQVPTAIYHLLRREETPLIRIKLENRSQVPTRRLRVTSVIDGYSAAAVDTFDVPVNGATGAQLPTIFPERVNGLTELTRATVNVLVEALDGTGVELQRTEPVWLLAKTSAPYAVRNPSTGGWVDLTKYFGAFVTPNAPKVLEFLEHIVAVHPERRLVGYQDGPAGVRAQVEATYAALKATGVRYVNSTIAFGPDEGEIVQRVRLPSETLGMNGANCIDGTVLFASLLEAMSLNAAIVALPGHAIVAWETDRNSQAWDYLDTVLIGDSDFAAANERGKAHALPVEALFGIPESKYQRWSIRELRSIGITPTY